jgi:hypothetical protein
VKPKFKQAVEEKFGPEIEAFLPSALELLDRMIDAELPVAA